MAIDKSRVDMLLIQVNDLINRDEAYSNINLQDVLAVCSDWVNTYNSTQLQTDLQSQ